MYYPALFAGICGLLYLLIGSDITKIGTILIRDPKLILICLVWTICCSILTYYLFNSALSYLDVSRASLLSTFEPVAAVIFGVVLFHEQIDVFGIIGIIMVFVSLVLNEL
jgi:drug/metabolite transporter (DMT)-like permease